MLSYIVKRLAIAIPTLLLLIVLSFLLMHAARPRRALHL